MWLEKAGGIEVTLRLPVIARTERLLRQGERVEQQHRKGQPIYGRRLSCFQSGVAHTSYTAVANAAIFRNLLASHNDVSENCIN